MKKNLPYLNQERLDFIFNAVYENPETIKEQAFDDSKLGCLLLTLKTMQHFNHWYRSDDTRSLFTLLNPFFNFERNSEGTTLWLSLILAIQELYGFSETKLVQVMQQVSIRK
jgi:hypothetical protein